MIGVMGAGAFGTALAISLASKTDVILWSRDAQNADHMQNTRENRKRLPNVALPAKITISADTDALHSADQILLAVPMQQLSTIAKMHRTILSDKDLIACCKGVDLQTGKGPVGMLQQIFPTSHPSILTGPSFAADIARGLPTALTLANADPDTALRLQPILSTDTLRLYISHDVIGAELGGGLKNIMAIACGATIGAGMGESARAAIITRGFAELRRFALAQGAQADTLIGLSGFGDLVLTCTSDKSRNYRFGQTLAKDATWSSDETVEGVTTARAVAKTAANQGIDMPITKAIVAVIEHKITVKDAIDALLARPLKKE
ncbi:NAD(P)H-dependent glycerol-3-phosphate dehydrogenase [Parasulfitobacter algicola]|uniref:Glycerol-3-phosphate dehydrogenase [NAD(P)+] n=1 Tax=Parasulfitobacter algicola TaxID=2614809 RepID=A0ABX2IQB7_9RHOB|nr:NAD(P)H-dependent glycerol-3-phosphate dehydrogenase [Sulfitobacter algicola]NSX55079.1 NAD(P)-dependent glycerol-3-phosphate dehydrogenase [Sulfitobacter algicola]